MVKILGGMTLVHYTIALFMLGLLWHAGSVILGADLLPRPLDTTALFLQSLSDPIYLKHVAFSAMRLTLGLLIAAAISFPLGLLLGHFSLLDRLGSPMVFITYPLPKIVLLPVFFVLLGLGESSRVLLIALTAGYQILVIVRDTALRLNRNYIDAVSFMGGNVVALLRHVYIPAALPGFVTGLKIASGTGVAVLFLAESFATDAGLGFLIMDAWGIGDTLAMFNAILGMGALGITVYVLLWFLEHTLCHWKFSCRQ